MYVMKKTPSILMMSLILLSAGVQAEADMSVPVAEASQIRQAQLPPAYPDWPERFRQEDTMPPPPPGPYMSSALSRIDAFPSGDRADKYRKGRSESPLFKPEMPWPEGRDRPQRWVPEEGEYHYVPDGLEEQLEAQMRAREVPPEPAWRQQYPQRPPIQRPPVQRPPPVRPGYYGYRGY
jgi:hypothetical protein